ncbi:MAG: hypothetical protein ABSC17_00635 [Thermacetogeniaceae bacterium]
MSKKQEQIRLQRLPGRGSLFDLFRQVSEKIRRDKAVAFFKR